MNKSKKEIKEKWQLEQFDTLEKLKKNEGGSIWKGEKGIYVIRHMKNETGKHLPLAKVILNNEFLTGLFKTKNNSIFSGDIRKEGKRQFILFKVVSAEKMEVQISAV